MIVIIALMKMAASLPEIYPLLFASVLLHTALQAASEAAMAGAANPRAIAIAVAHTTCSLDQFSSEGLAPVRSPTAIRR
jgi:hypothetical protein